MTTRGSPRALPIGRLLRHRPGPAKRDAVTRGMDQDHGKSTGR